MKLYVYLIILLIIIISFLVDYILKSKKRISVVNSNDIINNKFNEMISTNIINIINDDIKNNIIITLTTIPTRFITTEFDNIIKNLSEQKLKPKSVVINLCKKYNRVFEYDKDIYQEKLKNFESKFDNVIINICDDYGPGTKLIGLENFKFKKEDIVIILDDDIFYNKYLTTYYALGYQLYNSCGIAILNTIYEELLFKNDIIYTLRTKNLELYYDNYNYSLFGCRSYSFKSEYINDIIKMSKILLNNDKLLWKHDDILFTYCYKKLNLKMIGMNLYSFNQSSLNFKDSLYIDNIIQNYRRALENKYNLLDYNSKKDNIYSNNYNVKIINKRFFLITIETQHIQIQKTINLLLNNKNIELKIYLPYHKQTLFYQTNFDLL
jgi:hypothetical protein